MFAEIFSDYVTATERQFPGDRRATVGASEIGQCARRTWYLKRDTPHDADHVDSWGARVRGSVFEQAFWEPALRLRYGEALKGAGARQRTLVKDYLSATPDGLVVEQSRDALARLGVADIGEGGCFLVECKTRDPRTPVDAPKPEHAFQLQVQLGLVRERSPYRPECAVIFYTDASWWHDCAAYTVNFDPAVYAAAKERAATIMTANDAQILKAEGFISGGKECDRCPYAARCGVERRRVPGDIAEADTEFAFAVAELAREAKRLEAEGDAIAAKARDTQQQIRDRLRERGVRKVAAGGVSVAWSSVAGRTTTDSKALREAAIAAGIDVEKFTTTGEPGDRLTIRVRNDGADTAATPAKPPASDGLDIPEFLDRRPKRAGRSRNSGSQPEHPGS